ncbi:MAG: translation elongation factor Ts [Chloroflexi bacterium]|nr:translation elongation factor Ts [Chloroflexota bacterium]
MAGVTTEAIKALREKTGAGVMESKRALEASSRNLARAEELLREWGLARAAKRAGRVAAQGLVEAYVHAGGRIGVLVEVNCETDFVARTDEFKRLAHDLAMQVAATNPRSVAGEAGADSTAEEDLPLLEQPFIKDPSQTVQDLINEAIRKLGENVVVRRFCRYELGAE